MPRLLVVTHHRKNRSPGQRFRFEQYLDYLESNGFDITFSNFISESDDKIFYAPGNIIGKIRIVFKNFLVRTSNVWNANEYDIILIYREAFVFGTSLFEYLLSKSKAKIVFDFDDSIWLLDVSTGNKSFAFLKNPNKTAKIISYADLITVGNSYLAEYAKQFNSNVIVVPTTIDTSYHKPLPSKTNDKICIGWTGTDTTIKHFEMIIPVLLRIKEKYKQVYFKLISDRIVHYPELDLTTTPWSKEDEIEQLAELNIGIMPLPDDKWSRGKCGFKGLQYMALSIATVMSPVGVNKDIIQDGINGFLAANEEEWFAKLSLLIEDALLRQRLGEAGRTTIETSYSVNAWKDKYLEIFRQLV